MSHKFGVGVLGATGYIGTPYRREIREASEDARIVALCARRRDRLEAAAAEDGATLVTNQWREVVEHPEVDLVVIATPDALHYDAAMACAELRKHVVCEKPVGKNVREALEIWNAYRDTGLGHFVPYWTRYLDVFRRARVLAADGVLGEIKAVVYRWHNPRPPAMPFTWRDDAEISSAGTIADVGSHAYDALRWMIGGEASRVLAHAGVITPAKPDLGAIDLEEALAWGKAHTPADSPATRQGTAFDYASIAMDFPDGIVGTMILSHAPFLRKSLAPEVELHGTHASLAMDRTAGTLTIARGEAQPELLETIPNPGWPNRFADYVFPAIRAQARGERQDHPGLDDGYRAQLFTDAAARSAQRGEWVNAGEA